MTTLPGDDCAAVPRAQQLLALARWAANDFARYDAASAQRIMAAVARVAEVEAEPYARWAVRETGSGVVEHKATKNRLASRGLLERYGDQDYVTPRSTGARLELPRPAGVLFAVMPSTNPISTLYTTILLSLLTRNALVLSPPPLAAQCSVDAARVLARAAVVAGAPDGVVQIVEQPTAAVLQALIGDERVARVIGDLRPGNVPVLVDASADPIGSAQKLLASKAFDNSLLPTSESVLIVEEPVADQLLKAMGRRGAALLTPEQCDRVRDAVFPGGRSDPRFSGRDAATIAEAAGITVPAGSTVLLAPLDLAVPEDPLAHPKPFPVLGVVRVPDTVRGIRTAVAVLRIGASGSPGGAAVIHSTRARTVLEYLAAVRVPRVAVNQGGSELGPDLEPEHLLTWTTANPSVIMQGYAAGGGQEAGPWHTPPGPVPPYPLASNLRKR
jgi:acetaldehyde dehydrogenase / alcohol dehydrogenase